MKYPQIWDRLVRFLWGIKSRREKWKVTNTSCSFGLKLGSRPVMKAPRQPSSLIKGVNNSCSFCNIWLTDISAEMPNTYPWSFFLRRYQFFVALHTAFLGVENAARGRQGLAFFRTDASRHYGINLDWWKK